MIKLFLPLSPFIWLMFFNLYILCSLNLDFWIKPTWSWMTFLIMCLYLLVFYRGILIAALTNSSFSKGLFMPWKFPFWSCLVGIWCVCRICVDRSLLSCVTGLGSPHLHLQFKGLVFGGVEHFLLRALVRLVLFYPHFIHILCFSPNTFLCLIHSFFSNVP